MCDKDVEKENLCVLLCENGNWWSHYGKQYVFFSEIKNKIAK